MRQIQAQKADRSARERESWEATAREKADHSPVVARYVQWCVGVCDLFRLLVLCARVTTWKSSAVMDDIVADVPGLNWLPKDLVQSSESAPKKAVAPRFCHFRLWVDFLSSIERDSLSSSTFIQDNV